MTIDSTIKDIATHNSGLGLGSGDLMTFPGGAIVENNLLRCFQHLASEADLRVDFKHNNLLYIIPSSQDLD